MREVTNIRDHRIRWNMLAMRGAYVGAFGAIVMLCIAAITLPLFNSAGDMWSFLKITASGVLGEGAATPLTGFEAAPVLVGLVVHLVIGVLVGATYALVIAMFDLEGWTPVALFGLLWGAMLFVWSAVLISAGFGPQSAQDVPLLSIFLGNMAFGLTAGVLLATWANDGDLDQEEASVKVFEQRGAS